MCTLSENGMVDFTGRQVLCAAGAGCRFSSALALYQAEKLYDAFFCSIQDSTTAQLSAARALDKPELTCTQGIT